MEAVIIHVLNLYLTKYILEKSFVLSHAQQENIFTIMALVERAVQLILLISYTQQKIFAISHVPQDNTSIAMELVELFVRARTITSQ